LSATEIGTEQLWFLDTLVTVRVSAARGEDGISVLESRAPYGDSPPLHIHRTEDEVFHVLSGELRLVVGDEEVTARPGATLLTPKGVPHTYVVTSAEGATWLVLTARGDFERFVRATSRPAGHEGLPEPGGPPPPEAVAALAEAAGAHGIDLVGPPLSP
jgi:mannose-6-phosphate isomerase-like protein (cupin superfamily)